MLYDTLVTFGILMACFTALVMLSIGADGFFGKWKPIKRKRRGKSEKVKHTRKNSHSRRMR